MKEKRRATTRRATERKSAPPTRARATTRSTYHHGNLPEMMEQAVLEVIAEKGVESVNVSEAARRAGVSGGAPYRHFKDREDLLVSVARSAYRRLWQRLQEAIDREKDPAGKFIAIIDESYRYFSDEPAATELLFHSGITIAHRELDPMSHAAFDRMMEMAASIAPSTTPSERKDFVMAFVALCYGSGRMRRDHFSPVSRPEDYPEIGKRGTMMLIEAFKSRPKRKRN